MPLYKIVFTDNSIFIGGETIEDSKWNEIPDKDILCLEYFLCEGSSIVLREFESYAAITEVVAPIVRKMGNCPKCNMIAKATQAVTKHAGGKVTKKLMARCTKCKWVGNISDLKNAKDKHSGKWKYVMGLKNGIVSSYRIALGGTNGQDRYQSGDITKRSYPKGKEYNGKPIADFAWKKGIK
jgi:hypothetical protein